MLTAEVGPGDVLYLPATWFHHVAQRNDGEGKVIAVNYWFDMQFGPTAAIQPMLEKMQAAFLRAKATQHTPRVGPSSNPAVSRGGDGVGGGQQQRLAAGEGVMSPMALPAADPSRHHGPLDGSVSTVGVGSGMHLFSQRLS